MSQSKDNKLAKAIRQSGWLGKIKVYLQSLGPVLITGASDDDPSGIGTYAQTGTQFGYAQLWTALFTFMQDKVNGRMSNLLGWVTTMAMTIAAVALLFTFSAGR